MGDAAIALVPAAGAGLHGGGIRKQYLELDGTPILIRTLRALAASPAVGGIVVAAPEDETERVTTMIADHSVLKVVAVVPGGPARQDSVERALAAAPAEYAMVLVHDAVRPFVTGRMIERSLAEAARWGGAVVGMPMKDTLKRVTEGTITAAVEREGLVRIQTPQVFRRELLADALASARRDRFVGSDESSLVVRIGGTVRVVEGEETNIKITTPGDLPFARAIIGTR